MPAMLTIGRRSDTGFTLIELLIVVVIIGILAAIAIPKFSNSKGRAIVSQMKSDLRNMVTAQEAYMSDALTYHPGPVPSATLSYDPSGNVSITLSDVSNTGWAATATSPSTSRTCAIFVGSVPVPPAPATTAGIAACTP
jgi:prepilin-type N-terminal cleavage/methylation domain-containing protein